MIHTGDSVRVKSVGPFTAKVYAIRHDMKEKPAQKSKQAVIDADVDKKFTWTMLRDVDSPKIQKALREAFAHERLRRPGAHRPVRRRLQQGRSEGEVRRRHQLQRRREDDDDLGAERRSGDDPGQDFMKAVWSIWFGKIDQPAMGDQLIAKL